MLFSLQLVFLALVFLSAVWVCFNLLTRGGTGMPSYFKLVKCHISLIIYDLITLIIGIKKLPSKRKCFLKEYSSIKYVPCCELPLFKPLIMNSEFSKLKGAF